MLFANPLTEWWVDNLSLENQKPILKVDQPVAAI